jgi:tyrosyl-tRNA synthetase
MPFHYDFNTLKAAILFNTVEVLPSNNEQLDQEIHTLVENANSSGEPIRHYIGFEISGQIHIGTGIMSALKIKKLQDAGVKCSLFLADYHTYLNEKLDGKMETIRQVATDYFGPVMLKCCEVVGCKVDEIDIILAASEYQKLVNEQNHFAFYLKVAKEITLSRVLKSVSIMGKTAGDSVDFGTLCYPVMQVADAFFMQTHLVHAGLDQRKCHVLMRETATKLDEKYSLKIGEKSVKPIAIHHSLLLGLEKPVAGNFTLDELETQSPTLERSLEILATTQSEITLTENGQVLEHDETVIQDLLRVNLEAQNKAKEVNKMSKSKPDSAIWVHDSFEEILRKLKKAYCPMPEAELVEKLKFEINREGQENQEFKLYFEKVLLKSEQDLSIYTNQIINSIQKLFSKNSTYQVIKSQQEWNPMLDWCKKMIFPAGKIVEIQRPEKFGGDKVYNNYENLELDYFLGNLHPLDLKTGIAKCLADWFAPILEFVKENPESLEFVKNAKKLLK